MNRKVGIAIIYFTLSTIITWWFIEASPLYESTQQKLLSCGIAGAKWSIQLCAAFVLLKEKRWDFIKNISITCLAGSVILLPYAIMATFFGSDSNNIFIGSLMLAVAVMILLYALSVRNVQISIRWWLGWMVCLVIAIVFQLTVVFHIL